MSTANEKLVTDFCNSFFSADINKVVSYLTEDVYYHNIPWQPVTGHAGVRKVLGPFIDRKDYVIEKMDIKKTASSGDVVMNERVETWVKGSVRVELPVVGVFTIKGDKIVRWCDYFDSVTLAPLLEPLKQAP
ncbi:MAG: nuclear transport factor 2 family protein [Deltaproteobacteria bacterium]|nr:nuclear transport factor 2 family protein [Deltaproteobacteria bacterium]